MLAGETDHHTGVDLIEQDIIVAFQSAKGAPFAERTTRINRPIPDLLA
jgi:hypothetical protein